MEIKRLCAILIIAFTVTGVSLKAQTTIEEYNYITKGYKVQIETGLDMKKGYEIENIDSKASGERSAELKILYRVKDNNKEIAAYMIVYQKSGNAKEYICVPSPKSDEEIIAKYWSQLYEGVGDSSVKLQLISFLLTKKLVW